MRNLTKCNKVFVGLDELSVLGPVGTLFFLLDPAFSLRLDVYEVSWLLESNMGIIQCNSKSGCRIRDTTGKVGTDKEGKRGGRWA